MVMTDRRRDSVKARTGRPLKNHKPGGQVVMSILVPAELKMALQKQAIRANRSLSAEVELLIMEAIDWKARP